MSTMIPRRRARNAQAGITLIEIMIALLISLILVFAIGNIYLGSKRAWSFQSAFSHIQENARYATDRMAFDLRMAGYFGCNQPGMTFASSVDGADAVSHAYLFDLENPIRGFESSDTSLPATLDNVAITGDIIVVAHGDGREHRISDPPGHNPSAATIPIEGTHDFDPGDLVLITDCNHSALYVNTSNTKQNLNHNTGNNPGTTLQNCEKSLGVPAGEDYADCNLGNLTSYEFSGEVMLMRFAAFAYYLGDSSSGNAIPSLYRLALGAGGATPSAQEIIEGVEDMRFLFGIRDVTDPDVVGSYQTTAETEAADNWEDVIAVRISMLFTSLEDNVVDEPQEYLWDGAMRTPDDRRLRQVVTTTVGIRNRLP